MSLLSPRAGDFVAQLTNTAGTFNTFTLLPDLVVNGDFVFSKFGEIFADGATVYYDRSQSVNSITRAIFETGLGTYSSSANTITPTVGLSSSNMSPGSTTFVPITWGAGTQTVVSIPPGGSLVTLENLLAAITQLATTIFPVVQAAGISGSGGTNGRAVRISATPDVYTDAQNTDTSDQLSGLLFKWNGAYYSSGDVVTGISSLGFTTGQVLWLGVSPTYITTSPPTVTPGGSTHRVQIGKMLSTDRLRLTFTDPIGG